MRGGARFVANARAAGRAVVERWLGPTTVHRLTFAPRVLLCVVFILVGEADGVRASERPGCLVAVIAWPFLSKGTFGRINRRIAGLANYLCDTAFFTALWVVHGGSTAQFVALVVGMVAGATAISGLSLAAVCAPVAAVAIEVASTFVAETPSIAHLRPLAGPGLSAALGGACCFCALVGVASYRFGRHLKFALDELAKLRQTLETQVADRTAALASTNAAIERFVPREFLHALGHDDVTTAKLGDASARRVTVLFADIRNFTSLSERMSPAETFAFLNACLSRLGPHVRAQSGFVDKYIGDAIMALFPRAPADAVRAAILMQTEVAAYNARHPERAPLGVGVGIHVGEVMMGTIGEAERFEATVISDAVNLTARLESLTKPIGCSVIFSGEVHEALDPELRAHTRRLGTFVVKGKTQPVALHEHFAADSDALRETKFRTRDRFAAMLDAVEGGSTGTALAIACELRDGCPDDGPATWWCMRLASEAVAAGEGMVSNGGIVRLDEK